MESALVSLTFDDGLRCQFERAVPVLDRHGFPATFFLVANEEATHQQHVNEWFKIDWREGDIAMLKQLIQNGHEIGSHTVTHDRYKMRLQPDTEAFESKTLIERWIETKVSSFCYPHYRSHEYLADSVKRAGYEQARGGGAPPGYVPEASYYDLSDSRGLDRFNVDCRQITNNEDVGGWVRSGCWHVLTYHGIGNDNDGWEPISVDQFSDQMAKLASLRDSGEVKVVTFKDGASRLR